MLIYIPLYQAVNGIRISNGTQWDSISWHSVELKACV